MEIIILLLTWMGFIYLTNAMQSVQQAIHPLRYNDIRSGSFISVAIEGRNYVECGVLYDQPSSNWDPRIVQTDATGPFGQERAYVRVINSTPGASEYRDLAAKLTRHPQFSNMQNPNPQSIVIIKGTDHFYFASISRLLPSSINKVSIASVFGEYEPGIFGPHHGVLNHWPRGGPSIPPWVVQGRPRPNWLA